MEFPSQSAILGLWRELCIEAISGPRKSTKPNKMKIEQVMDGHGNHGIKIDGVQMNDPYDRELAPYQSLHVVQHEGQVLVSITSYWEGLLPCGVYEMKQVAKGFGEV
jgi:hypothetical protein